MQRLGGDDVTTPSARTADQTEIARFWVESSPRQWNRLRRAVATAEVLDPLGGDGRSAYEHGVDGRLPRDVGGQVPLPLWRR